MSDVSKKVSPKMSQNLIGVVLVLHNERRNYVKTFISNDDSVFQTADELLIEYSSHIGLPLITKSSKRKIKLKFRKNIFLLIQLSTGI